MVILVEILGKFVGVIGHECRGMCQTGFGYFGRETVQYFHQTHLLSIEFGALNFRTKVYALVSRLAEYGLDAGVGVLYEWARVAVEVYALLRVEKHCFLRVHLDYEILERSEREHPEKFVLLLLRHSVEFSEFE